MNKLSLLAIAALIAAPAFADTTSDVVSENKENTLPESEFMSDERTEEGFITHYINNAIASGMQQADQQAEVEYGRKVTSCVSAPKFGGYFIGKYDATSQDGKHSGNGFTQRLIRFYVDGTILNDFAYRIQIQTNNASFHMKDFFVEWKKYAEFKVKIGQYKRAFGLENPMNPWDVGVGDYSQLTKKLTGHSDFIGAENTSNGGRDQGIQIQGDLFPAASDGHRFVHYQLMVSNGQGINTADANSQKDITGTIQIQPIKGLFVGAYGWTGNFTSGNVTVDRNRYLLFAKYDANDWSFRTEFAHSTGHKVSDFKTETDEFGNTNSYWAGTGRADAWYATVGIPCTPWLKTWLKY
ncbi:MAG: porin, partial [Prevotellaceae bacterium]|nr:porin [Prevotellaceae bacterium]